MESQEISLPWTESLTRIRTLADITERLSLVFVFGPGYLARRGLKQVSDAVRGQRRILWHRLDEHGADLSESLIANGREPVVLLVHGMESVGPKRRREIAIALNTGRNALKSFPALVIFWIPEDEQEDFFRFSADLLHWRTLVATATADELATYDVFLSHASADKPAVEILARRLRDDGLEPFLDMWHLVPGEPWQEALEQALEASRTCAVFVGRELGPGQNEEMRDALDKRILNADYRVIPILLPGASRPDRKDLPRFLRRLTWVDFSAGLDDDDAYHRLVSGIRGVAPDVGSATATPTILTSPGQSQSYRSMAPASDQFVHRRELDALRDLLVDGAVGTVGITTALHGAGGFGKTALAQALCEDPAVREAYPAGVLWAQMRDDMRDADRLAVVQDVIRFWHCAEEQSFETLPAASARLREVLDGQRVLMVVDDAWRSVDVEPFGGLGPGTALLVTTRDGGTLPTGCRRVDVDAMASSEAVTLLAHGLSPVDSGRFGALARRLGEWPLLLRLVNLQLLDLVHERKLDVAAALKHVESRLVEEGLRVFNRHDATKRDEALSHTINLSLDALAPEDRRRFLDLAVFPEDVGIPIHIIERLWGLEDWEAEKLCHHLEDYSLLLGIDVTRGTVRLHDVMRRYLIEEHGEMPTLHRRLLARCRPPSGRWTDLAEDETYLWRHLAGHLAGAGERAELRRLLFDLDYLEAKLRTVGINALLADYDVLGETGEPRTVQVALRLSAHVLTREWGDFLGEVLAGQLLGRLDPVGEAGRRLLQRAEDRGPLRPRRVKMNRTGGPLVRTLEGHTGWVNAVAVLDEKRAVSASSDQALHVWDVDSGETIRTLEGHSSGVRAVAVLDEKRVVSASDDYTLRVWDVESGETLRSLEGHSSGVNAVAVLDEKRVVSASLDHTLRVWDVDSGESIRILEGHTSGVDAVAVLDEKHVISASFDRALRVWDVESGETLRTLQGHTSGVRAVAVLDEKRVVSASFDRDLRVWDVESGETLRTLEGHSAEVNAVTVLTETCVVSASDDQTLRVWDIASGETLRTLEGHTSGVNAVAALDEKRVVSTSDDRTLRLWNVELGEPLRTRESHSSEVNAIAVLGQKHVVSASSDRTLRVWDVESGKTVRILEGHISGVNAVAALDEKRVVSASFHQDLRVWDVESGETIRTLEGHSSRGVNAVAVLDEKRVVSASSDRTLRVWDVDSGETILIFEDHMSRVNAIVVLDEKRTISACSDGTLRVWDIESGETIRTLAGHSSGVNAVAVLDGTRVVSASSDPTLRVWDLDSGETIRTLEGHSSGVNAVEAVDERHVVSVSSDHTLSVWDIGSGERRAVFALDAPLRTVAVTADGRTVVAGDQAGGVHFLDLDLSSGHRTRTAAFPR